MFAELRERVLEAVGGLLGDRGEAPSAGSLDGLMSLATPKVADGLSRPVQVLLAGGTLAALGIAGSIAAVALGWLVAALASIYFLLTKVLGLNLQLDPSAFSRQPN